MDIFILKLFFVVFSAIVCLAESKPTDNFYVSMVTETSSQDQQPALFTHAESPVWDMATHSLYFVDVHQQNVHRFSYATGKLYTKHIGHGQVNVVALVAGSQRLLVAVRASLYLLDWEVEGDAALRLLTAVDLGLPSNVINDGKPDSQGRFWAGTKGPQKGDEVSPDKATLYSVEQAHFTTPRVQLRPVTISNGLTWALNDTVFYYIDSPTQKVEAFDYDVTTGDISRRRTILDITEYGYEDVIPDGMTIDSDGHLWVALMFGGTVLHIDPDRRQVVDEYKLPVSRVTSLEWGGPNLDDLFVTTSRQAHDALTEPYAGAVFILHGTGSRGLPAYKFKFDNADTY
ncbi:hypothetical protein ACJJTC_004714 [Scirpophaga incertulas]